MPVTPPSRPVHEAPADALPESPPVVDTTPSPDAVDVPPPAPAVPIHAPSHGGVAPVIKPHPTPGAIPVFGEPADTDLDAVAALNTTEASASSGSAAHDAAPVGGVDAAAGGVTWSGGEDMAVLDPKADLGDSFESTRFADAEAAPFDFHEMPVPVSSAFEDHFSVTQVASMPTFALTASTAAAGLVPANPRGSVADEFEPESQRDAQRRWASRFSDAGQGDAAQAWDESHEGNSPPSPEDSGVYVPVASDGFFARLWGAVRGLGGSLSRSHADEREHKRG